MAWHEIMTERFYWFYWTAHKIWRWKPDMHQITDWGTSVPM